MTELISPEAQQHVESSLAAYRMNLNPDLPDAQVADA